MADINQIITLGVGTPGDIEHFILVGLNASEDPPSGSSAIGTRYSTRYRGGWIYLFLLLTRVSNAFIF